MRFLINPLLLLPRANNLFTSRRRRRCVVDDDESITATTTKTSAIPGIHESLLKRNPIQVFFHRILVGNVSLYTALGQHKSVMKRLILTHPPQPEIAINHAGVVTEIDGRGASSFASVGKILALNILYNHSPQLSQHCFAKAFRSQVLSSMNTLNALFFF